MQSKLLLLFFFFSIFSFSQTKIKGNVNNSKGIAVSYATIQLIDAKTNATKDYTSSIKDGSFFLTLPKSNNNYFLKVTLLGYIPKKVILNKNNNEKFSFYYGNLITLF
jgi:hypothetical protein